jgi:hypothetical protein
VAHPKINQERLLLNGFQTDPEIGDIWEVLFDARDSWVALVLDVSSEKRDPESNDEHFYVKVLVLKKDYCPRDEGKIDTWNMWHHDKHEWFLVARV